MTNRASEEKFGTIPFTEEEKSNLEQKLARSLHKDYVSTRSAGYLSYIEGWRALNLANEIFGFNGWSSNIISLTVDFVDEANSRFSVGVSCIIRVTLKDGTFHEDVGYGMAENCKRKAEALEKSKKEAVTDAIKRAFRNFGNVLGNCLYDKEYLRYVAKLKPTARTFDEAQLYQQQSQPVNPTLSKKPRISPTPPAAAAAAASTTTFTSKVTTSTITATTTLKDLKNVNEGNFGGEGKSLEKKEPKSDDIFEQSDDQYFIMLADQLEQDRPILEERIPSYSDAIEIPPADPVNQNNRTGSLRKHNSEPNPAAIAGGPLQKTPARTNPEFIPAKTILKQHNHERPPPLAQMDTAEQLRMRQIARSNEAWRSCPDY